MRKNKISIYAASVLAGFACVSAAAQSQDSDWYLVDERITGPTDDLVSNLLFADWNSLRTSKMRSINVSDISMREVKVDRKFEMNIVDSRMNMMIDCDRGKFNISSIVQYDQNSNIITMQQKDYILGQWTAPNSHGLAELITFTCEPESKKYEQPFGANIQPLTGLIHYLNADWSK